MWKSGSDEDSRYVKYDKQHFLNDNHGFRHFTAVPGQQTNMDLNRNNVTAVEQFSF